MRHQSSEAVRLDGYDIRHQDGAQEGRPSFDVYEGGGLDARARQGVSHEFLSRVRLVCAVAAVVVALGFVRVGMSTATVAALQANDELQEQIDSAQSLNDDLKVSKSVLSSASRIERIATQNYGMVPGTPGEEAQPAPQRTTTKAASKDKAASASQQAQAPATSSSDESADADETTADQDGEGTQGTSGSNDAEVADSGDAA